MAETRQFKTESKRLLELMVHSIYTNREIFLRELISNSSDAIDKYHVLSLTDEKLEKRNDYEIFLSVNKKKRWLKITDNGIGMTYDELNDNLGTIAASGSREFLKKITDEKLKSEAELIGQFGVGFYSSFMVAKKVVVETKSPLSDKAYRFTSDGTESYTLEEISKDKVGTDITLYLRDNKDEDKYDEFLESYRIRNLVKKYSDYIRYPIKMEDEKEIAKLDKDGKPIEGKYVKKTVVETLNSMIPLWRKSKTEVTEEAMADFYKNKFSDYEGPLKSFFVSVEGLISYNALLFIPNHAPYNLYDESYERGLKLYAKGVFIMDPCKELIPSYLRFMKGLVDSPDLSLNISREMVQQNKQVGKIAEALEKKILGELEKLKTNDYDKYLAFFKLYGINLKYGLYELFGIKKDSLKDLLVYTSMNEEKPITLKKYVEAMKKDQKFIYFASAKTKDAIRAMPQMDRIKKQGYDVLVLTDDIDEFALSILDEFDGKKFKSINQGEFDELSKDEQKTYNELKEQKKSLLEKIKEMLQGKVADVVISKRLADSPVCLVSGEGLSFEMEKVLQQTQQEEKPKAQRILEINPHHDLFKALERLYLKDPLKLAKYAELLYSQALLIEGFPLENPLEFSNTMIELMIESTPKE
ncbi:MAG TPA: molecular chaperone HtpG [Bacilli bacterium]|nr:molecular chaperone HtpG [Bacilli bacterium]